MTGLTPFSVLNVCMGNICRSPMAERLLVVAARRLVGDKVDDLLYVHGAGTGGWHHGSPMDPAAARQLRRRGDDPDHFRARRLEVEHIEASDLILTATWEQCDFVVRRSADAASRTFVLGEFGRLLPAVDAAALPGFGPDPDAVYARGVALVSAVDAVRGGRPTEPSDDLDDPWGCGDVAFARTADRIAETVDAFAVLLLS